MSVYREELMERAFPVRWFIKIRCWILGHQSDPYPKDKWCRRCIKARADW